MTVNWFDGEGYVIGQSELWRCTAPSAWALHQVRLSVPEDAEAFSTACVFENAVGTVKLDDVAVSWFKEKWELKH